MCILCKIIYINSEHSRITCMNFSKNYTLKGQLRAIREYSLCFLSLQGIN